MEKIALDFIHKHNFKVSKDTKLAELCEVFCKHIDALIFNVSALAALVVLLYRADKLEAKHIPAIMKHILDKCNAKKSVMRGGTVMASDYYGYNHPAYSAANEGSDVLPIDLASGLIARPALGPQTGGGATVSIAQTKVVKDMVKDILHKHKLKYSRDAFKSLLSIVDSQMECLAADLRKCEPLSVKKVKSLLTKKRYFVFR